MLLRSDKLTATPEELCPGMNSVSIVVANENRIIEPRPKKNRAII
jgi:hypothetical protein